MIILYTILVSVACAILYRMGGAANYDKLWRRLGCPLVCLPLIFAVGINVAWWVHLVSFLLCYGALTTYHDYLGEDNFWVHGFTIGFAYLPYAIFGGDYYFGIIMRSFLLAIFLGGWSAIFKRDIVEEFGRGAFIGATLPMIII